MNINTFKQKKKDHEKIVMVTCYDAASAAIVEKSKVDCVLVGDSVAMVVHGHESTVHATMDMMHLHTQSVARKIKSKFIVADLPFLSYRNSLSDTMHNVQRLMQAGAHAVKLEGCTGNLEIIKHIVESGVPVMGHLGLTPQAVHQLGGHTVQGRTKQLATKLLEHAQQLEKAGVFALVLECIPSSVATKVSQKLSIPTIGIGAGPTTDGQVLVFHDLLGLQNDISPKFLKRYHNAESSFLKALNKYAIEVIDNQYPELDKHTYQ